MDRKPYLAVVTWEDAYYRKEKVEQDEINGKHVPLLIDVVGYVVRADDDVVIIAAWRTSPYGQYATEYKDYHHIPRGMVRKIQKLYVK